MLMEKASEIQNPVKLTHPQVRRGEFRGIGSRSALESTPETRSPCFTCSRCFRPIVRVEWPVEVSARDRYLKRLPFLVLISSRIGR